MSNITKEKIVFVAAARTPVGRYLGGLKDFTVPELSEHALNAAIDRFKIDKTQIDEVIIGHVIG